MLNSYELFLLRTLVRSKRNEIKFELTKQSQQVRIDLMNRDIKRLDNLSETLLMLEQESTTLID